MAGQGDGHRLGETQGVRFVHFHLGVAHRLVGHDQVEDFLGQAFEQSETIAFDMLDDRLGDGAVVQRVVDVVVAHGLGDAARQNQGAGRNALAPLGQVHTADVGGSSFNGWAFTALAGLVLAGQLDTHTRSDLHGSIAGIQPLIPAWVELCEELARTHDIVFQPGSAPVLDPDGQYRNRAFLFGPDGLIGHQDKIIMTRFEREQWHIAAGSGLKVFDTALGTGIVFNGAIYNHRELRAELEGLGHVFSTHCDTEVLLAAISQWGVEGARAETMEQFNDLFGNIEWHDADKIRKAVTEDIPARVAQDKAYQNAQANSDKQNAKLEHDKALNRVVLELLSDHTELFKQVSDNPSFKRWLTDMVFDSTYHPSSVPPKAPPQAGASA